MEDDYIQAKLLNQPRLWETEGWAEKIGVEAIPDLDNGWAGMKGKALEKALVKAYGQAVHASANHYLSTLTLRDLEREVKMDPSNRPVTDLLSTLVIHNSLHGGEIAALGGLQGLQRQPV